MSAYPCHSCHAQSTQVIDSRWSPHGLRRRRRCRQCGQRFSTYEREHGVLSLAEFEEMEEAVAALQRLLKQIHPHAEHRALRDSCGAEPTLKTGVCHGA